VASATANGRSKQAAVLVSTVGGEMQRVWCKQEKKKAIP
jgi:hypothetical protein